MPISISCIKGGCLNEQNGGTPCPAVACLMCSSSLSVNKEMDRANLERSAEDSLINQRIDKIRNLTVKILESGVSESVILGSIVYALESLLEDYG